MISPATVARHVANIMLKLGFRSRAQIAAWITDRRIAGQRDRAGAQRAARASSTVSSAAGSASSRWSGIGLPLSTERP